MASGMFTVRKPAAGNRQQVSIPGGASCVSLDFDLGNADFDLAGKDLRVEFDDGACLEIRGCFAAGRVFVIADGSRIDGEAFYDARRRGHGIAPS